MRAREGAQLARLGRPRRSAAPDAHVPLGTSRWEMGTSRALARQGPVAITRNRTRNPQGRDPATTTFVFVTPRLWPERDAWRDARRNRRPGADVRAYDADDLETWLERAPSVPRLDLRALGREPRDVKTPDSAGGIPGPARPIRSFGARSCWLVETPPALTRLYAGALAQPPQVITVVAGLPRRGSAQLSAPASSMSASEVDELGARSADRLGCRHLGSAARLGHAALVLIPTFEEPDVAIALRKAIASWSPCQRCSRRGVSSVELPPLDRRGGPDALIEATALDRDIADQVRGACPAAISFRSAGRIAVSPAFKRPAVVTGAGGPSTRATDSRLFVE